VIATFRQAQWTEFFLRLIFLRAGTQQRRGTLHFFPLEHEHLLTEKEFKGCCKSCERSFRLVHDRLIDFNKTISNHTEESLRQLSQCEIYSLYLNIDDIAHLKCDHDLEERIMASQEIKRMLPAVRHYYKNFFDIHEKFLVTEVLEAEDPWQPLMDFGLYPRYETLIKTQMESLSLGNPKRIAFIGSGPMPLSLILMHRLYGIESVGVDFDDIAVSMSRKSLERLGLSHAITIVHGTEKVLEGRQWDAVIIAALAEPKSRVFSNLREIMRKSAIRPVICRTYSGLRTLLHPPLGKDNYDGFVVQKEIMPEENRVNNTLLQLEMVE